MRAGLIVIALGGLFCAPLFLLGGCASTPNNMDAPEPTIPDSGCRDTGEVRWDDTCGEGSTAAQSFDAPEPAEPAAAASEPAAAPAPSPEPSPEPEPPAPEPEPPQGQPGCPSCPVP